MTQNNKEKKIPPRIQEEEFTQDRGSLTPEQDAIAQKAKTERLGRFSRWPAIVKSSLFKLWVAGAACFFVIWGGFKINSDVLDSATVVALAIGILTDFIINPVLEMTDSDKCDIHKFIMVRLKFKNKALQYSISPILNFLYAFVICLSVIYFYQGINQLAVTLGRDPNKVFLPVEPILYGLFYVGFDLIGVTIRNLIVLLIKRSPKQQF